jgi:phage baseplate assembly protein W
MSYQKDFFSIRLIKEMTAKIPLEMNSDSPGYKMITEDNIKDAINYDLKSILLTHQGERFDGQFGVGLRGYLFENYRTPRVGVIKLSIQQQIEKYMPWITNFNVIVQTQEKQNSLSVSIKYKINNPQIVGHFNMSVSVSDL